MLTNVHKYSAVNKISDKRCLHPSKAYWPNLQTVPLFKEDIEYLVDKKISNERCLNLNKVH